uniref:Transcription factor EAT1-like isoform X2 n=1 Tax=Cymbidium ensifolium TaxID=78740 RepID=A0A515HG40_CYMEN|nr:transcription factor EAT1-like isoform X2 [Cymbidium ensifolium]
MFNPQSAGFIGGLALISDGFETITSQSTDLPLMAAVSGFDYHRQFEQLNPANSITLDPSGQGDSPVSRMLAPTNFQSLPEGLISDFSSYGTSVVPTIFYDPAVAMNMNLEAGFNHEYGVYGGQVESCEIERRKRKVMMMRGMEEFGTQKNEKQRRERLGKKFEQLKTLIPNPTKPDRATIVSDTIDYIKELLRTVDELKILVGKKRSKNARSICKLDIENEVHGDMESSSIKSIIDESDHALNGSMRSSWIQRRSKSTFVDVRIIEDEVYIKLEQRKLFDCALIVSRVLDELQLELLHLSCGNVGDSHVFMISTKTNYEGSPIYASSVARRFIEVMGG